MTNKEHRPIFKIFKDGVPHDFKALLKMFEENPPPTPEEMAANPEKYPRFYDYLTLTPRPALAAEEKEKYDKMRADLNEWVAKMPALVKKAKETPPMLVIDSCAIIDRPQPVDKMVVLKARKNGVNSGYIVLDPDKIKLKFE